MQTTGTGRQTKRIGDAIYRLLLKRAGHHFIIIIIYYYFFITIIIIIIIISSSSNNNDDNNNNSSINDILVAAVELTAGDYTECLNIGKQHSLFNESLTIRSL